MWPRESKLLPCVVLTYLTLLSNDVHGYQLVEAKLTKRSKLPPTDRAHIWPKLLARAYMPDSEGCRTTLLLAYLSASTLFRLACCGMVNCRYKERYGLAGDLRRSCSV